MAASYVEKSDDAVRKASEFSERWKYRLSDPVLSFREKYLGVVLELGIRQVFGYQANYGFTFAALDESVLSHWEMNIGTRFAGGGRSSDAEPSRHMIDGEKPEVFAFDVELVEHIKPVVPSFVRPQRFDDRASTFGERL